MYKYVSSLLRSNTHNVGYLAVNIANMRMFDLLNQYSDGYIELSNPSLFRNIFVPLSDIRDNKYPFNNTTFNGWLTEMGNKTINGVTVKPTLKKGEVTFIDAFQGGYKVSRIHRNDSFSGNVYPRADLTDVFIHKTFTDKEYFQKHVLTSINGLLHLNIPRESGVQIVDAGKTLDVSQDNHVGILSFEQIGSLQQVPITDKMIGKVNPIYGLRSSVYLNLGLNIRNKKVLISFCGLLLGFDDLIDVINSNGLIRLNLHRLNLADIFLNIRQYLDVSEMDLDEVMHSAQATRVDEIVNEDTVIKGLLKLSQTFLIIVDNTFITQKSIVPNPTKLINTKEWYLPNQYPYMSDKGLLLPYWKQIHPGQYTTVRRLYIKDTFYHHPVHDTSPIDEHGWINNVDEITNVSFDDGRLLLIQSEELEMEQI